MGPADLTDHDELPALLLLHMGVLSLVKDLVVVRLRDAVMH